MIKLFESFAGYGTSSFALKQLGIEHELVGFSEIDKYAVQCFQQNHGGINFGDITKINWIEVPNFDLLTGGFPCQSFSTAGKQQGELDPRGQLGLELTRALIEKQPKYFLFENVKGFMSKRFNETREKFIQSWKDAGYNVTYKVLNTKNFGVPQNRERIWFIGIRKDIEPSFSFPEPFDLKLKLKDILEPIVNEKYFLRQEQVEKMLNSFFDSRRALLQKKNECSSLNGRDYKEPKCIELTKDVSQAMRVFSDEGISCTLKGLGGGMGAKTGLYSISLFPRSSTTNKGGTGLLVKSDGASYCLDQGNCQAMVEFKVIDVYNKKIKDDGICITLSEPHHNNLRIGTENQVRRLTPKECFRLQGFLNDEINLTGLSDTQCYKLAGNGQSVNVVKLLLKELKMELK